MAERKAKGTDPRSLSGVSVGTTISFLLPRLEGGFVHLDNHFGEVETYEVVTSNTSMPKIKFTLKDNVREFVLRPDFEIRLI